MIKNYTITNAAIDSLATLGGLREIIEIHDYILDNNLYTFKENADSLHILTTQINRKSSNSNLTEKSKELHFYKVDNKYGLIKNLSDLEKTKYLSEEQLKSWYKHNYQIKELSSEEINTKMNDIENTLEDISNIIEEARSVKDTYQSAKDSYEEDLKLHATRKYWQRKRSTHRKQLKTLSISFLISLIITILTVTIGFFYFDPITETIVNNKKQIIINYNKMGLLLLISSIGIWISRLLLKVLLSNLHLQEEAREKETMIISYLALMKEGGLDKDDRVVILDAIFRPSSNGIIKDDTNVTLLDIMNTFKRK